MDGEGISNCCWNAESRTRRRFSPLSHWLRKTKSFVWNVTKENQWHWINRRPPRTDRMTAPASSSAQIISRILFIKIHISHFYRCATRYEVLAGQAGGNVVVLYSTRYALPFFRQSQLKCNCRFGWWLTLVWPRSFVNLGFTHNDRLSNSKFLAH